MLRGFKIYRLQAIPVVVIFAVLVFLLLQLLPGDPAVAIAGSEATPEAIDRIRSSSASTGRCSSSCWAGSTASRMAISASR